MKIQSNELRWLSEVIATDILGITGGSGMSERKQIAAALFESRRIILDDTMTKAADVLLTIKPATIILPPVTAPLLWLQYSQAARPSMSGITIPDVSGILLMRDPHDEDTLLIMSGWGEGHNWDKAGIYPCLAKWSLDKLSDIQKENINDASLIQAASFGMSIGMRDDMQFRFQITREVASETEKNAYWRLSRELGFAVSVLSLLTTSSVVFSDVFDERGDDYDSTLAAIKPPSRSMNKLSSLLCSDEGIRKLPLIRPIWVPPSQGVGL